VSVGCGAFLTVFMIKLDGGEASKPVIMQMERVVGALFVYLARG
jgi:hypothetical protein